MVCDDSRHVKRGDTFVCLPCAHAVEHCVDAINRGAKCIVLTQATMNKMIVHINKKVHFVVAQDPRMWLIEELKKTRRQPKYCIAVTGTNGKSSVVHYCHSILKRLGKSAATLGTLGLHHELDAHFVLDTTLTTQTPASFYKVLCFLADHNVDYLAYEASSQGLAERRVDICTNAVVAFTNLSQDHLDYHGTMEKYFQEKMRLFALSPDAHKIVCASDVYGQKVRQHYSDALAYGTEESTFYQTDTHVFLDNHSITKGSLRLKFSTQIDNLLCAVRCLVACGIPLETIIPTLPEITQQKGRLEEIQKNVFIDYAHTPDALRHALLEFQNRSGKMILVFGCGGERDKEKREQMGEIAKLHADCVVVTDDNPRHEDPKKIRQDILRGCPEAIEIADRSQAILHALSLKQSDADVVVIAGKGHETKQAVGDEMIEFSDESVVIGMSSH